MRRTTNNVLTQLIPLFLIGGVISSTAGCAVAPKVKDRPAFIADARVATAWFEENVSGVREQIDDSAGYIIFPAVGQWGTGFGGGNFGRGMLNKSDDSQIGWTAISTPSLGLQVGIQGHKMLVLVEDAATLEKLKKNALSGSVTGVAVLAKAGGSVSAPFRKGVVVHHGENAGLMAGVNLGLEILRFEPLDD